MRHRVLALLVVIASLGSATTGFAQGRAQRRVPRAYLSLSDGVGVNAGGAQLSSGSLWQGFRASGVLAITPTRGVELSAVRVQQLVPVKSVIDDRGSSVKGDGAFLSYAALDPRRDGGFPTAFSIGAGVMRRPSVEVGGEDRDTWAIQLGAETSIARPSFDWADVTAGARVIGMPAASHRQSLVVLINFGIRVG